jgi:hypothetical protein
VLELEAEHTGIELDGSSEVAYLIANTVNVEARHGSRIANTADDAKPARL